MLHDLNFDYQPYIGKYCTIEFQYSAAPTRKMEYDGVVERVDYESEEEAHLVVNVRYGGRIQLRLNTIVSIREAPYE